MKHHCQLNVITVTLSRKVTDNITSFIGCNNPHLEWFTRAPANGDVLLGMTSVSCGQKSGIFCRSCENTRLCHHLYVYGCHRVERRACLYLHSSIIVVTSVEFGRKRDESMRSLCYFILLFTPRLKNTYITDIN